MDQSPDFLSESTGDIQTNLGFRFLITESDVGMTPELNAAVIKFIHYISPLLLLSYFLSTAIYASISNNKERAYVRKTRVILLLCLIVGVLLTYIGAAVSIIVHALNGTGWWEQEHKSFYVIGSMLVWGLLQISLLEETEPIWYPHWGSWLIGLLGEVTLLVSTTRMPAHFSGPFRMVDFVLVVARISFQLLLVVLLPAFREKQHPLHDLQGETSALLAGQTTNIYGTANQSLSASERRQQEMRDKIAKRKEEAGGWLGYAKTYFVLWNHMWPSKDKSIQTRVVFVFLCLGLERGLNVLVPVQMGKVTESLVNMGIRDLRLWLHVSAFILYRWLSSASGIRAVREYLWIAVRQFTHRSLSIAAYNHILDLSCDFHTNKKTGELVVAFGRGRSIDNLIDLLAFSVIPNITDFVVAFMYFYLIYSTYMALIIAFVSIAYFKVTTRLSRTREEVRRRYNKTLETEYDQLYKSFGNWTTVSYFNRFSYEKNRYMEAIQGRQQAQLEYDLHIALISVTQNLLFTLGLLLACFLAVYKVSAGERKVGDFVTLLTYWAQLSVPLTFFTTLAKQLQDEMIDAERLLEILNQKPTVLEKPDAKDLVIKQGEVVVSDVTFSYDKRKQVLKNVSFSAPGGKTVAVVGETGGGKSTFLKLLFRFYDVDSGSITIDGQDIKDVSLNSLRDSFGMVPQDPSLFSGTIMENLRYARFEATDEEIHEACRAACIHDKILSFPDAYLSKVGEQGVKLSGGEKQRIAIARAFLKRPAIVILDEATSSVDVLTEKTVQEALDRLTKGRTVFVVAHRLTTIMNADLILLLKDGEIYERGNHHELMQQKGVYWSYWTASMDKGKEVDLGIIGADKIPPSQLLLQTIENGNDNVIPAAGLHIKFAQAQHKEENQMTRPHTLPNKSFLSSRLPNIHTAKAENSYYKGTILKPDAKEFIPGAMKLSLVIPPSTGDTPLALDVPETTRKTQTLKVTEMAIDPANSQLQTADTRIDVESNPASSVLELPPYIATERKHKRRRRRSRSTRNSSSETNRPIIPQSLAIALGKDKGNAVQILPQDPTSTSNLVTETRPTTASTSGKTTPKSAESTPITPTTPIFPFTTKQGLGEITSNGQRRERSGGGSQGKTYPGRSRKNTGAGVENLNKPEIAENTIASNGSGNKQQRR